LPRNSSGQSDHQTIIKMIDRKWIGHKFAPYTRKIEKGQLWFFAKAIGETNPIFTDEVAAKAAGYPALPAPPTYGFSLLYKGPF